ncbi:unnamed protein product [Caenorhabditis angaria]|uniref:C-type lectin domain-containing protein n=1 Tax=Caenorhabditis angaria TaxID=860376 RepID=A0A9P1ISC1_9PELO|nr:unnamed protein product [Caenorhabditis angaria]
MLILLYFSLIPLTTPVNVAKIEIPYAYLVTRDHPSSANYNMNDLFNSSLQKAFDSYCKSNRCYFPVFKDSGVLKYTILTDVNSTCLSYPNCLGFTQEQYQNYSIVFGDPSIQDNNLMDGRSYEDAKCPSGYFSFTRANGLNWCGEIIITKVAHNEAENRCKSQEHYLNGFQSIEEQKAFLNFTTISRFFNAAYSIHLGASGSLMNMTWSEPIVSTNQTLAGNMLRNQNTTGDNIYLVLYPVDDSGPYYSLITNTTMTFYSCGWYA